ncbi:coiled-coil domain-containing protein [Falsiroseomonas tokyonensis]|uniref:TolA protein n=1 Tax=Falsiroseomonas tokyonensis TaxID=430521 RepID=A0ABV7BYZ1_9PROT|nr:hypothetical protein [Falsiroseomonas tokyonensis]MBU8540849.1 hypothetical protein [Falsiroseomonas tokyonensis]
MSETTEIAVVETRALVPTQVYAPGGVLTLVEKLEAEARAVPVDISTAKGRDEVKSLAYKIARSKTALDDMGKKLNEDARARINAVDADRRLVRDRLDALKDEVRKPLTEWEDAEKARVKGHEDALAEIAALGRREGPITVEEAQARISAAKTTHADRDWREFRARALHLREQTLANLVLALELAERQAREAEELARLRAEQEERERQEAERLQAEREARIAEEAAETARQAERARAEAEARAAQEQAEVARLAAERQAREAEQRAAAAEARAAEEARQAEAARVAAEQRAERERQAAVEAERQRVAEEAEAQRRADEQRAADRAHRGRINSGAVAALLATGVTEEQARVIVTAIISGSIPNVSIRY